MSYQLEEDYFGGVYRHKELMRPTGMTIQQAVTAREQELGRVLTLSERRAFMAGWRYQLVAFVCDDLRSYARHLRADDVDALGQELYALARKWGGASTLDEMETRLQTLKERAE